MRTEIGSPVYGLVAEFAEAEQLVRATRRAREEGYRHVEAYSPYPVHGLAEALDFDDWRIPWMVFLGGVVGAVLGYLLAYYINVIDYPLNVGGRPLHAWPAFVPITFECTILLASITATFGMLALNGLPRPHHSIFNAPRFDRASQDRFFLCIEADDPKFDAGATGRFLRDLGAEAVSEVGR